MRKLAPLVFLFVFAVLTRVAEHELRTIAQEHKEAYEVMLAIDAFCFVSSGGDAFGYDNYFKWSYARWLSSPERTWWQKAMFWKVGIIYEAGNPPEEYAYPAKFDKAAREKSRAALLLFLDKNRVSIGDENKFDQLISTKSFGYQF